MRAPHNDTWHTLGRHQLGAVSAALIDFSVMVLAVQRGGLTPVEATALGTAVGALANFGMGRFWIFRRRRPWGGGLRSQAIRYAAVAAASATWNVVGEHLLHDVLQVQYVVARMVVATAVSLTWNFPMQRRFVFREGGVTR